MSPPLIGCICLLCPDGVPTQEDMFCNYCRQSQGCIAFRKFNGTRLTQAGDLA